MRGLRLIIMASLLVGAPLRTSAQTAVVPTEPTSDPKNPICSMVEAAARANALPIDFFARLIWQESRFRSDEVGPTTRTGEHALGIAQFMPGTAIEHGLYEPFNPVEALPKSSEFLAQLRSEFGNVGLAAAAYNAGPQRVRDFLAGFRDLPSETRHYVLSITGHPVEDWVQLAKGGSNEGFKGDSHADNGPLNCDSMVVLNQMPNTYFAEMLSKVPIWCRYLHHPNVDVCGPIHQTPTLSSFVRSRSHLSALGHHAANPLRSPDLTAHR
jgi:Transglycosylase SLT domain